jgi:hypothetical protein
MENSYAKSVAETGRVKLGFIIDITETIALQRALSPPRVSIGSASLFTLKMRLQSAIRVWPTRILSEFDHDSPEIRPTLPNRHSKFGDSAVFTGEISPALYTPSPTLIPHVRLRN